ncbi:MAG: YicC family protein [Clostridiales bacterium]|nr:YicC family protein [Clostridiales bacterium]
MRSMTGYGRRQIVRDGREMTVEIKTVNHRFLDLSFRLPRALNFAEDALRKRLGQTLRRGHVDVNVSYLNLRQDAREVRVDEALVLQYKEALLNARQIARKERSSIRDEDVAWIVQQPDVMQVTVKEEDQEAVLSLLLDTVGEALADVSAMREKEGAALQSDLTLHLNEVARLRDEIAALAPRVPVSYQEKLQSRLRELGVGEIDPQRLAQEVALMADRCAVDEELSRLASHIGQMRAALQEEGEAGRRLDFLTQELNREANTIGSKASDADITRLVVAAKSEIEKLREQIQNVE